MPAAIIITCAWYSSWLISSAARAGPSCSAAIQDSAASSTSFLPIAWIPASSSATVREPSGRVAAFSDSSANSPSNVFIGSILAARGQAPEGHPRRQGGLGRLASLVLGRIGQAGAVESLLLGVARQQPEAHRHSGVERHPGETVGRRRGHVLE